MPVEPEDLEPFVTRTGPVHVVGTDGSAVAYGASARLDIRDGARIDAWTVEEVELTLLDEQARKTRAISGSRVIEVRAESIGYTVVVEGEEAEPGPTVQTRGT